MKVSRPLLLCVPLLVAIPALASQITIGSADPGTGNCFPFGCAYTAGTGGQAGYDKYLEVYGSSAFSGPVTITSLQFFNTQINKGATGMNSGTFTISLSTTTDDSPTSTDSCFGCALGSDNTTVFSGSLAQSWTFEDTLTINFSSPFTYNPAAGNLLMYVEVSGASDADGVIYFDNTGYNSTSWGGFSEVATGNSITAMICCNESGLNGGLQQAGEGLVTGFTATAATIPEPSGILLFGSGLLGLLAAARRRHGKQSGSSGRGWSPPRKSRR